MKITLKNQVKKFQMGGQMAPEAPAEEPMNAGGAPMEEPAPEEAPAGAEQQDPIMMLAQMAAQALQSQDCQAAMQVCQAFLELILQAQGGAPEEPQGEPVFRQGGKMVRRIRK